ncbi:MAG: hypothetical protein AAGC45_01335 [Bacteroidota bacterium]
MKRIVFFLGICFLGFYHSCTEKDTTFLISNEKIGKLDKISLVRDLELIYEGDSLVKDTLSSRINHQRKIRVYEKGGKHLLTLTPTTDSIPTIANIAIQDPRFETENGIGLKSTFKDVQNRYKIKKIVTTLNSVVIFPKGSPIYFTIDKSELPSNLRYTASTIDAVQIPDEAKLKYLMIGWE